MTSNLSTSVHLQKLSALFLSTLMLVSCGGGGDSSAAASSPPPPPAPVPAGTCGQGNNGKINVPHLDTAPGTLGPLKTIQAGDLSSLVGEYCADSLGTIVGQPGQNGKLPDTYAPDCRLSVASNGLMGLTVGNKRIEATVNGDAKRDYSQGPFDPQKLGLLDLSTVVADNSVIVDVVPGLPPGPISDANVSVIVQRGRVVSATATRRDPSQVNSFNQEKIRCDFFNPTKVGANATIQSPEIVKLTAEDLGTNLLGLKTGKIGNNDTCSLEVLPDGTFSLTGPSTANGTSTGVTTVKAKAVGDIGNTYGKDAANPAQSLLRIDDRSDRFANPPTTKTSITLVLDATQKLISAQGLDIASKKLIFGCDFR